MTSKSKHLIKNETSNKELDLVNLLGILIDFKWTIISITAAFTVIGIIYALLATPIYTADALIQVERNSSSSMFNRLSEMIPDNKPESDTEIELLKSRMILGKTIQDLNLDIIVTEKNLPLVGKGLSSLFGKHNNSITISSLNVSNELLNKDITLKVITSSQYEIEYNDQVIRGSIGTPTEGENIHILINEIDSTPGTTFIISKLSKIEAINQLAKNYDVIDKTKDGGILQLSLEGEDPKKISKILNVISNIYLQQNVERKSEEAAKSLEFLKEQISIVKSNLSEAENSLNKVRQQNVSIDLSLETKSVLDTLVSIESQLNELVFKEMEISKLYTKNHPVYKALTEKKAALIKEKEKLDNRVSEMPKTQQDILRLTRDVQSGQEVYMLLLNRQQELSISKASTVGNIRIVDTAITQPKPKAPKKPLIILGSLLLGGLVSIGFLITKSMLNQGIQSTEEIENIGISVYASIPLSTNLIKKNRLKNKNIRRNGRDNDLLAVNSPADLSVEAIRSLRTNLYFSLMESANRVLMITSATPEVGKSFICCNLATVIAQSGKRILFIDGDIRKGQAHNIFDIEEKNGLSEILAGNISYTEAVKKLSIDNIDVITRGRISPNPSELLLNRNLRDLLEWGENNYDLVIIDTPPVLAVTDACIIGKYVGTSLMVSRFQKTTAKELINSYQRLEKNGITAKGIIFNGIEKRAMNAYEYNAYTDYSA